VPRSGKDESLLKASLDPTFTWGGKVGVLVEVNCETDFVARTEDFLRFVKDLAMHICAAEPQYVSKEDVPAAIVDKEREIARGQAMADPKIAGKPEQIIEKLVQGRVDKFYTEVGAARAAIRQGSGNHGWRARDASLVRNERKGPGTPLHSL
jgi:translation elongation factor EF-Ts